ncbi:hypothetical protein F5984_15650 [Rudanella paleaurantiibacter]|uniref:Uncharacterized protein n=1 Tax=Rudanella paleaurantiibacter TaxID=2614655 RepID=A0A7J5TWS4_9BACT|nr:MULTISPECIES: hypothetical protein [Rudanella]KAB7729082.1 hypothetical protein F5984_15650 [Rudanella paleaurantiibacter]
MNITQQKLTRQAVRMTATTLILAQGCTTAVLVKNALRRRGYNVYLSEVSKRLFEVARREGWSIEDIGSGRVFYFAQVMQSVQ